MMDDFDEKRSMVKMLMDMLKGSAAKEVSDGLKKPEGEPDDMHGIQVEKVEMVPDHEMDEPTPEHDVITHEMHEGGEVAPMDQPKEMPLPTEDDDTEDVSSNPFAGFLGKKKKR